MIAADEKMAMVLTTVDLEASLSNGQRGHEVVFQMIKHEMHHHGQLINFTFCHHLPIAASWQDEWALSHD